MLVISRFGFDGWIWVPIASVPGLCILFTLTAKTQNMVPIYDRLLLTFLVGSSGVEMFYGL